MVKVAVLGAGPNGLASAIKIKETFGSFEVVIISNEFTPNTTADGSGGMWHPYLVSDNSDELVTKWGLETYYFLEQLWLSKLCNISILQMYNLRTTEKELTKPKWADAVHAYRILEGDELDYVNLLYFGNYVGGHTFKTYVSYVPDLLSYLQKRFLAVGGKFLTATIGSLEDSIFDEYEVIVNCTGLGARLIVPDNSVYAIRGQIHKVKASWINAAVIDVDAELYIIPNANTCVLGGTSQKHDYNTNIDVRDKRRILDGCFRLIPALKNVDIVEEWVGLRPGRDKVQLTREIRNMKLIIHNYGHGGSGITLFWGCASDVLNLLEKSYNSKHQNPFSKI